MALKFWNSNKPFRLKSLLGLDEEESDDVEDMDESGEEPDAARRPGRAPRRYEGGGAMSLQDIVTEEAARFGKVSVVTLKDFRAALGDKWPKLGRKVALITEGVIQRQIGPANFFGRQGEDTFLIIFRGATEEESRARTATIADDLGRRLVGADFEGLEGALVCVGEANAADLLGADGRIDAEAVGRLVSGAKPHPVSSPTATTVARSPKTAAVATETTGEPPTGHPSTLLEAPPKKPGEPGWVPLDTGGDRGGYEARLVAETPTVPKKVDPKWAELKTDHSGGLPEARLVAETPTAPKKADPRWAELKTDHSGGLPEARLVAETPTAPKKADPRWAELK
ncbi:MAG: hypothetical protein H7840_13090, partial [Alphaproteobacteria bacterium]